MPELGNILAGRASVDAYREAHRRLHEQPWHRGIPREHTPLLYDLMGSLGKQGFSSPEKFFSASDESNMQELGFASKADFDARATIADRRTLEAMWE